VLNICLELSVLELSVLKNTLGVSIFLLIFS
jgi:hypothetical protein